MKSSTAAALAAINQRFYQQQAAHFDRTRDRPWRGWQEVLRQIELAIPDHDAATRPLEFLDLGCGNGRLAAFLSKSLHREHRYLGVDSSSELLATARGNCRELGDSYQFEHADVLAPGAIDGLVLPPAPAPRDWPGDPGPARFDVVLAFGLLHHIPGTENRLRLLRSALDAASPSGLLCLSSWKLEDDPRFERRNLPWRDHPLARSGHLELDDLDQHDHLLSWGGDPEAVRYCHHVTHGEIEGWIASLRAEVLHRFHSDGPGDQLNEYLLLRASE